MGGRELVGRGRSECLLGPSLADLVLVRLSLRPFGVRLEGAVIRRSGARRGAWGGGGGTRMLIPGSLPEFSWPDPAQGPGFQDDPPPSPFPSNDSAAVTLFSPNLRRSCGGTLAPRFQSLLLAKPLKLVDLQLQCWWFSSPLL